MMIEQKLATGAMRPRRNLRWMAIGVLAVCLGGLGGAVLYGNVSNTQNVVTVKRTVYRGQVIAAEDLGVSPAGPVPGVETLPSERLEEAVGRTALYDLAEGSLLTPRGFGEPKVESGFVLLGLRLPAGRAPTTPMPPGTEVLLVPLGRDGGEPPQGASVAGRIATSTITLPDGASGIDVSISATEAERVARLAANDQLSLVLVAG